MKGKVNKLLDTKDVQRGLEKISRRDALMELMLQKAMKGDIEAARTLLALAEEEDTEIVFTGQGITDEQDV